MVAADAGAMEKVEECGLILFREGGYEEQKIVGEGRWRERMARFSTLMWRRGRRNERQSGEVDTRWRRREAAHPKTIDWKSALGSIRETF